MKNFKRAMPLIALAMISGLSVGAAAEGPDNYAYLGGGAGSGRINGEDFTNTNGDLEKSRVSWKALAGAKLGRMLSLEGQYIDFGAANRDSDHIQATGWTGGVVLDVLAERPVTPYIKAGVLFWDTDRQFNNITLIEEGTDPTFGAGVRFMVGDAMAIRAEYEHFAMDDTDIDSVSVSMQLNF